MPYIAPKQRLVVCLDGTWNNRDDTTNVFHHLTLALEGEFKAPDGTPILQRRFYHPGVGTGVLDKVSGGAFGMGIEENVRAAYNWLVENFRQDEDGSNADEIYIFGFSRGAYTARSLVGFISRCGLLRRGAPLTVNGLWADYCILGREREERRSIWEKIFGDDPTRIREISRLVADPWNIRSSHPPFPDGVPGQRSDDLTDAEKLLVRWSRRVRITYLGVYDTVGALGLDALAIPGLKSHLALHHNMRPTTLVKKCRHALALHEHRTSFQHTPLVEYVGHDGNATTWARQHAMWQRKIEQRWFVGSHANIGGGYPANALGQRPFQWIIEGAELLGLRNEPRASPMAMPAAFVSRPRDSYAEFLAPIATAILRVNRYYRPIDPDAEFRARRPKPDGARRPGFSLATVNEHVDASVYDYVRATKEAPPNLVGYATRRAGGAVSGPFPPAPSTIPSPQQVDTVLRHRAAHHWLGEKSRSYLWLAVWATIAAVGFVAACRVGFAHADLRFSPWYLGVVAAFFAWVEFGEKQFNFTLAAGLGGPAACACRDAIYWLRALGVVLFMVGAWAFLGGLGAAGWNADGFRAAWRTFLEGAAEWWLVPVCAGAGVTLAAILNRRNASALRVGLQAMLGSIAALGVTSFVLVLGGALLARLVGSIVPTEAVLTGPPAPNASLAGGLLLLQIGVIYFLSSFGWVGEPMAGANLGSITKLQLCMTAKQIKDCLDGWIATLRCEWSLEPAATRHAGAAMRRAVREALWRDIVGFIPIYLLVLGAGGWIAAWLISERLHFDGLMRSWMGLPLGLWPAVAAAGADWLEDFLQLWILRRHEHGQAAPWWLALGCSFFTALKFLGFILGSLLTLWALGHGSGVVVRLLESTGWRGTLVVLVTSGAALALFAIALGALLYRRATGREVHSGKARVHREPVDDQTDEANE